MRQTTAHNLTVSERMFRSPLANNTNPIANKAKATVRDCHHGLL
jgi:hypothetical protein